MATDLSRLRGLLQSIWEHCEEILPTCPTAEQCVFTSEDIKARLAGWSTSCAVVMNGLESAAIWFGQLGRRDDAERLRNERDRLKKLWFSTHANYTPATMAVPAEAVLSAESVPSEAAIEWLERLGDYDGTHLAFHIRTVGKYSRLLLNSLEAIETSNTPLNETPSQFSQPSTCEEPELVTLEQMQSMCGGMVSMQTILNVRSRDKDCPKPMFPHAGSRAARYDYQKLRNWFITKWSEADRFIPKSHAEAKPLINATVQPVG